MGTRSLTYFVNGIKNISEEIALKTAQELHHFAGTELKEMPGDESNYFLEQFNQKIFDLVSSPDYYDKRAGILAIMSLIGIDNGANSSRLSRCANYLRNMLPSPNQNLMELAAKAIGHLALSSETYTAEYVDFEAKRAFEWLTGERNEERRHAAVLILRELAICTPTIFVQHLQQYFETIFIALKDTKPAIRECASLSLRAVLNIVSQRESKDIHKPPWYELSLNQAFSFLQEAATKERSYSKEDKTHAGLLALNELIRIGCIQSEAIKKDYEDNTLLDKYKETIFYKSPSKSKIKLDLSINFLQFQNQMFLDFIYSLMPGSQPPNKLQELIQSDTCRQTLLQNYDMINNHVYKALSSRNMQVQLVLIEIIPRLAFLKPEKYNKSMMHNCLTFLIGATKKELYKSASFLSIGYLVIAAKSESSRIYPKIIECIKLAFNSAREAPTKKKSVTVDPSVFACLRMLTRSIKDLIEAQIADLLEPIFSCGISPALVSCLSDVCTYLPSLRPTVQENLLNYISAVITNRPYTYFTNGPSSTSTINRSSSTYSVTSAYLATDILPSLGPIELERLSLAIRTLREFDFNDYSLLGLVKYIADHHIYIDFKEVRIESIKTCFKLLYPSTLPEKFNPLTFDKGRTQVLTDILDRLIPLGVNDRKWAVRLAVFESIDESYDRYLVQPKHLAVFYMAAHDPIFEVRENVVCLLGRLATIDPSSLLPVLRKFLLQLLTDINDSGIGRNREHSARLISLMVAHMPRLVQLYVPTILKVLTPLLKDPGPNPGVTINALAAIGELALVCGLETRRWNHETFAIVVDMLKDVNLSSIREVALWTLGQLVESAGYVVEPYNDFPFLLDILMTFLRSEPTLRIRYETIRVMGIIGALDPFVYKNNLEKYNDQRDKKESPTSKCPPPSDDGDLDGLPDDCSVNELWVSVNASLEDFYPCAAITCLMRIVKEPNLSQHHTISVQAITFIFKSLGPKSHFYLRRVVPTFLTLIKGSENIREFLFQQLGIIASLVKVHLRNYLAEICGLIRTYWGQSTNLQSTVITLLNQLAVNMGPDIRPQLPELVPLMLKVLMYDTSPGKANTQKLLAIFQVLGNYLEGYLHMLIPAMVDIMITPDQNPLNVRRAALESINVFLQTSDMSEYCSTLVHPLLGLVDASPQHSGFINSPGATMALLQTTPPPPFPLTAPAGSYLFHSANQQASGGGGSSSQGEAINSPSSQVVPELRAEALQALTCIVAQLGRRFLTLFAPLVSGVFLRNNISHPPYETLLLKLLDGTDPSSMQYLGTPNSESSFTCYDKLPANLLQPCSKSLMDSVVPIKKLNINASTLQKSWIVKGRISKDDWIEWLKKFSIDILKESPSPSLRSCWALAQNYAPLAKDLFNASFVSCWMDLSEHYQDALIDNLQEALLDSDVSEVALTLLNLAEFMDHCEKGPLPLDTILLGQQAVKYRAYAKALRYKEEEFYKGATPEILESLICINNKLKQHEASAGILKYALKNFPEELSTHESWYEKLEEWEAALEVYKVKMKTDPDKETGKLGAMRCLEALGEWSQVLELGNDWHPSDPSTQQKVATLACSASWGIGDWASMEKYVDFLPEKIQDGAFYRAVISIKKNECDTAGMYISKCRDLLEPELTALASESYERAYNSVVMAQILSEMEEAIQYKLIPNRQPIIKRMWWDRLLGCQKILSNWHKIIQVHSLVITPQEDQIPWLKYVSLCNKNGRFSLSHKTLTMLLGFDPTKQSDRALMLANPHIVFSYLKYMWKSGQKNDAFMKLCSFVSDHLQSKFGEILKSGDVLKQAEFRSLLSKCYLKMGQWSENLSGVTDASIPQILHYYVSAIDCSNNWYKAWHAWACTNFEALLYYKQHGILQPDLTIQSANGLEEPKSIISTPTQSAPSETLKVDAILTQDGGFSGSKIMVDEVATSKRQTITGPTTVTSVAKEISAMNLNVAAPKPKLPLSMAQRGVVEVPPGVAGLLNYVILAVKGFIQSISFSQSSTSLQDTLRLLTLCFDYGHYPDVYEALQDGIKMIRIDNWLQVIPQLIARIDIPRPLVHKLIHQLLIEIGNFHPQALIYPLTVASKSDIQSRQKAAKKILQALCEQNNTLVQQALMVSEELIRVSILWHELWHEGLEDASRLYFGEKNIRGMLAVLEPLHAMIEKGPQTLKETSFTQAYGRDLAEAKVWCTKYLQTCNVKDLTQAWDLYYHVFRRISKELPQLTSLQLAHVSPKLLACRDLELAVPGTYKVSRPVPTPERYRNPDWPGLVRIARVMPALQVISSKQRPRKLRILGDDGVEYLFLLKGHEDLRQDERVMQLFGLVNTLLRTDSETVRRNLAIQRYSVVPLSTNSGLISWVPHCDTLHTLIKDHRESRKILLNIEHKIMLRMAPDYDRLSLYQKTEVFEHALEHTKGDDLARVLWLKSPPNSQEWFDRRLNYTRSLALMSVVGYILGLGDRHPSNLMLDRITGKILHIDFGDCFEVAMSREKFPEKVPFRLTRMLINAMEVSGIEGTFRMTCERVMDVLQLNKDSVMSVLEAFVYDPLINWRLLESEDQPESLNLKALAIIKKVKEKLTGRDFNSNETLDVKTQIELLIKQATSHENLCEMYIGWCPFW